MQKIIALVGRPNVGKSTLFNRLSKNKKAIVHDQPGVTRDRKYAAAQLGPLEFTIIDTPGLEEAAEEKLEHRMMQQTMMAISEADLVCLVVDHNLTPADKFFAEFIRKYNKSYILIVNKSEQGFNHNKEYYQLGFGAPIPISAEHGENMVLLYEAIEQHLTIDDSMQEVSDPWKGDYLQIAIVGRPNAGKSTFVNSLLGNERMLTGPEAGITRESVEIILTQQEQPIKLIDTAGLRKRANVQESLEKLSTSSTILSIRYANVVILMLDATIALEQQDLIIANHVIDQGRGLIIAVNKWDLIKDKKAYQDEFEYKLSIYLPQIKGVPVIYLSAQHNQQTAQVLTQAQKLYQLWNKRISTSRLNEWLNFALQQHALPIHKKLGRRVRIKYITQIKTRPPTFKLFTNDPTSISEAYRKYLINSFRNDFNMPGVPLRFYFTKTSNPYAGRK